MQHVAGVRHAVGRRRAFIEDEPFTAAVLRHAAFDYAVAQPPLEDGFLLFRKLRFLRHLFKHGSHLP